jgi:hypothetical protein
VTSKHIRTLSRLKISCIKYVHTLSRLNIPYITNIVFDIDFVVSSHSHCITNFVV